MSLHPLPSLILLEEHDGDWETYKQAVYKIFLDSVVNKLTFLGLPISCRYFQPVGGMHKTFWHLITENPENSRNDEDRIPDMRRCERIRWIPHIINNHSDPEIACWENQRRSNKNTVLWLQKEQYMIVLSKRKEYYLLTTAYVHRKHKAKGNLREMKECEDPRKG